jgi:hypothetical protein
MRCHDVGAGARGTVWIVGVKPAPGGFPIYYRKGKGWNFAGGNGVRISGGHDGSPWMVNDRGDIMRWQRHAWIHVPGKARDIGVGADGSVWIVGNQRAKGGFALERWMGNGWRRIKFGAARVAVGPNGAPWVISDKGKIFFLQGRRFQQLPGKAIDIGVGSNGVAWVLGDGHMKGLHRWTGNGWQPYNVFGVGVAVDATGAAWVADPNGLRKYR